MLLILLLISAVSIHVVTVDVRPCECYFQRNVGRAYEYLILCKRKIARTIQVVATSASI